MVVVVTGSPIVRHDFTSVGNDLHRSEAKEWITEVLGMNSCGGKKLPQTLLGGELGGESLRQLG